MHLLFHRKLFAVSALAIIFSSSDQAEIDAQKVLDAVKTQFGNQGINVTASGAELQGANVVVKGTAITFAGASTKDPIAIGDVVLENVAEKGEGYIIGQIAAPAYKQEKDGSVLTFNGASVRNVSIAGPNETDPVKKFVLYEGFDVQPLSVTVAGKEVFRSGGLKVTMAPYETGSPLAFDVVMPDIYGNLAAIPDPQAAQIFAGLGYSEINGQVTAKGSWNPVDGRLTLSEESFDFKDIGKLNFTLDLSGYTTDFVKGLQDFNKQMEGKSDAEKGMGMMGLAQTLNFHSVTLRFDDASLTGRILDFASKQSGQPKEQLVMQAKGMVPFITMQLQDAEFTTAVTAAVSAFLDNPKSLEIKAAPAAAVPFSALAATGMSNPAGLLKQLGVTVVANQ